VTGTEFLMPSLGADMTDGVITEWLVAPGEQVERGQIVLIVETDKSDIEVEIFEPSVVDEILVPEGERVEVGTPIARLRPIGDAASMATSEPDSEPEPEPEPVASAASPSVQERHDAEAPRVTAITSPLVRHLAETLHVDPAAVHGSGPGGRVRRDDVLNAVGSDGVGSRPRITPRARRLGAERGVDLDSITTADGVIAGDDVLSAPPAQASSPLPTDAPTARGAPAAGPSTGPDVAGPDVAGPDPRRRAVAALMTRSWSEIPHFHVASRLDLAEAISVLTAINQARPISERIIPAAVMLHAAARCVHRHQAVNGWWREGRFHPSEHVDLGVVVAVRGGGIVAPTIQRAEELTVDDMMVTLTDLVGRVRARKLRGSDVGEASFTVTNLGDLGVDAVYGVIHPPQVALLGLGAIHPEAVAVDGLVGAHPVVHVTLAGDHRALDGLVGATVLAGFGAAILESARQIPDRRTP
jgi:pyruvate dehydrogenase E2 component (dihydrolipoamide acetyltransferase)